MKPKVITDCQSVLLNRPVFRRGITEDYGNTGVETPSPKKSAQKFLGLPFCCTVEHVQLKNVTVDVMNISDNYSWCKTCSECIKMHHFEGENTKKISGEGHKPHFWLLATTQTASRSNQPFCLSIFS